MKNESSDRQKIKEVAARVAANIPTTQKVVDDEQEKRQNGSRPQNDQILSRMPRPMTRVSPFYPISRWQMAHRKNEELVIDNGKYGKLEIKGQLSIFDETVLLALLWLAKKNSHKKYKTNRHQICKLTGVGPATNTYNAILNSLKQLYDWRAFIKEPRDGDIVNFPARILKYFEYWEESGEIEIELGGYFLDKHKKNYTLIDLKYRSKLKGDITKALYRFLLSHGKTEYEYKFEYPLSFLCQVINIEKSLPKRKKRAHIKTALKELRARRFLSDYQMTEDDIVVGSRAEKSVWLCS